MSTLEARSLYLAGCSTREEDTWRPMLTADLPVFGRQRKVRANGRKRIRAFALWLLLAGWICANNPQAALVATITWLQEAHRHSGHQNLNLAVAELLGGSHKAPLRMAESRKNERPDPPPATAEFTLRKLELAVETGLGELVHGDSLCDARCPLALTAESRSYPPLLEPPRRTV